MLFKCHPIALQANYDAVTFAKVQGRSHFFGDYNPPQLIHFSNCHFTSFLSYVIFQMFVAHLLLLYILAYFFRTANFGTKFIIHYLEINCKHFFPFFENKCKKLDKNWTFACKVGIFGNKKEPCNNGS